MDPQAATRHAIECIWRQEWITLASTWLNENDSGLQVRPVTMEHVSGSLLLDTLNFQGMGTSCATAAPVMKFQGFGSVSIIVGSISAFDFGVHLPPSPPTPTTTCHSDDCDECLMQCDTTEPSQTLCQCLGEGACVPGLGDVSVIGSYPAVIQTH